MNEWVRQEWASRFGRTAPEKILCIGLNYRDHAEEQDAKIPEEPMVFGKFANTLASDGEVITVPRWAGHLDSEAELAVIIGRQGKNIAPAHALDHVYGVTVANDVSARELQVRDVQVARAKGFDGFCPVGPRIVPIGELSSISNLRVVQRLNCRTLQDSTTAQLIVDVPHLIAHLSRYLTLEPGDLILTGTPAGVGVYRNPPISMADGDEVEVEVEGIGVLRNRIAVTD
jgi:2-keto-4-pentenoate hydratase/2-oxohepta-3-ene-1,7-dioic acid hydratase in catechol pathway